MPRLRKNNLENRLFHELFEDISELFDNDDHLKTFIYFKSYYLSYFYCVNK